MAELEQLKAKVRFFFFSFTLLMIYSKTNRSW